jgi:hypothetical protein
MRKGLIIAGFFLLMLLAPSLTAEARGRFGFSFGFGVGSSGHYGYYASYPGYWYPGPYVYRPYFYRGYYPVPLGSHYYAHHHRYRVYRAYEPVYRHESRRYYRYEPRHYYRHR